MVTRRPTAYIVSAITLVTCASRWSPPDVRSAPRRAAARRAGTGRQAARPARALAAASNTALSGARRAPP